MSVISGSTHVYQATWRRWSHIQTLSFQRMWWWIMVQRSLPQSPEKNKSIKVSLNTSQGCTTLYFTGIFASGFISAAVWEKSEKKDQTYNRQRLLSLVSQRDVKNEAKHSEVKEKHQLPLPSLSFFFRSQAASKTLILSYYLALQTQPDYWDTSGIISVVVLPFPFSFVCFSIISASDTHRHTTSCK